MTCIKKTVYLLLLFILADLGTTLKAQPANGGKIKVIFDTDTNNEVDDQHALAYLLFSSDVFDIKGITVNATQNGGDINKHLKEAERVMRLCKSYGKVPLIAGANKDYQTIVKDISKGKYDGQDAVNFIIQQAKKNTGDKLIVLAVGKLTNLALALKAQPDIAQNIKIVWLGSNYPDPGEYNLNDDIPSLNYVLSLPVEFEMAVVRYGVPSGTGAVRFARDDIRKKMPGLGPRIKKAIEGRHGNKFKCFGDYSVDLFNHVKVYGADSGRSLFDMAAVAIVKNPSWATSKEIPAPFYEEKNKRWEKRPDNKRKIKYWERFNVPAISEDFYKTMKTYKLPE
ncbi:MAG: nucleoside hydrolase [Niabella sp.]